MGMLGEAPPRTVQGLRRRRLINHSFSSLPAKGRSVCVTLSDGNFYWCKAVGYRPISTDSATFQKRYISGRAYTILVPKTVPKNFLKDKVVKSIEWHTPDGGTFQRHHLTGFFNVKSIMEDGKRLLIYTIPQRIYFSDLPTNKDRVR